MYTIAMPPPPVQLRNELTGAIIASNLELILNSATFEDHSISSWTASYIDGLLNQYEPLNPAEYE